MNKWICFFQLLFPVWMYSEATTAGFEDFDKFIEGERVHYKVPGVAVAIVKDDKIIFIKGYGLRKSDQNENVDPDTIFQLASLSKTFTAAGLAVQVDQNKLGWDDRIVKFLPGFELKDAYPTYYTTTRDLLAHRTGLPAFGGDLLSNLGYTADEVLARIKYIEPASSFREKANYSNVGFFTAGQVLAKISGMSFDKAIQTTLLTPLRMTRTGFWEGLDKSNIASGHALVDGQVKVVPFDKSVLFAPAGGVTSTAHDLSKWMIMHLNGGSFEGVHVLKPETVNALFEPSMVSELSFAELPPINAHSSFSFGMGWDNFHFQGKYIVEKAGAMAGVRTVITLVPEAKIGIVVLANMNLTILPEVIRAKFLSMNFGTGGEDFEKEFAESAKVLAKVLEPPALPQVVLPMGHTLDQYTGEYESELYGKLRVIKTNDHLAVEGGPGRLPGTLKHFSNDTFLLKWEGLNRGHGEATFTFGPDGNGVELQVDAYGAYRKKT